MEVKNLYFAYSKEPVLKNISLKIKEGEITTLIGANGCGKSTLFNVMTKNLKYNRGEITLRGNPVNKIPLKTFARQVAIVHQYNTAPSDITVEALVAYGRLPYKKSDEDERYINLALNATGIENLRKKPISQLSGGQRQRAWIAMALAQNTKILFLDEPTTYLDIKYQIEILRLIKRLNSEYKITIIMVLHDINQAIHYSHNIIAMKQGEIIANGRADKIITSELIYDTYGIDLNIVESDNKRLVLTV